MDAMTNLTGKILIAMPGMGDPRFARSVVLICSHSGEGAMGLVLNRPVEGLGFADLLDQLDIEADGPPPPVELRLGGPVETGRGFVLHRVGADAPEREGQLRIGPTLAMTTTRDILDDLANGQGPSEAVLTLGYSGWGPGQLEHEMAQNGWLTGERSDALVFGPATGEKWAAALRAQGIDPSLLSGAAGHA